ncbi:MAG: right-handed parallel beta-helix repeat-containing protein [Planctomycetota bacterium]
MLYGGFPSTGGPWESRDPNAYETVLSGDLAGNDVDVNDPCELGTEPSRAENSYHVVTASDTNDSAGLDGVTITAGNADDLYSYPFDCGGGLFNETGSPTIENCTFIANSATLLGGAMCNVYFCSPKLTNCTFRRNSSPSWDELTGGGAMYNEFSSPTLVDCVFQNNCAAYGGAVWNYGSTAVFDNCRFSINTGNRFGGAVANHYSDTALTECIFSGGLSRIGGGIYNCDSNSELVRCELTDNWADWSGGGVYDLASDSNLSNCVLLWNTAGCAGGGVYCSVSSSMTMTNCTWRPDPWGIPAACRCPTVSSGIAKAKSGTVTAQILPSTTVMSSVAGPAPVTSALTLVLSPRTMVTSI